MTCASGSGDDALLDGKNNPDAVLVSGLNRCTRTRSSKGTTDLIERMVEEACKLASSSGKVRRHLPLRINLSACPNYDGAPFLSSSSHETEYSAERRRTSARFAEFLHARQSRVDWLKSWPSKGAVAILRKRSAEFA